MQAIQQELINKSLKLQLLIAQETERLAERQRREKPGLIVLAGAAGGALIMLTPLVIKKLFFNH